MLWSCLRIGYIKTSILICLFISGCGGGSNSQPPVTQPEPQPQPSVPVGFSPRPSNTTCLAGVAPATPYKLTQIFSGLGLAEPVELIQVPGDSTQRIYIAERGGRVLSVPANDLATNSDVSVALQLDVFTEEEAGITSMAFHPNYAVNGLVYIAYVAEVSPGPLELRLSSFERALDGLAFENESILLRIHEDNSIHFGGALAFGPDGFLYMSVGDDGDNTPSDLHPVEAGNPANVYGSILRLDVDNPQAPLKYGIPTDNPDLTGSGPNEVWAYGFRNPWRMSFDRQLGTLWSSNVGSNRMEEINLVEAGLNYGWPVCEGPCEFPDPELTDPVHSYPNVAGAASIGGFVYRGSAIPNLVGKYIFGDFVDQEVKILDPSVSPHDPTYVQPAFNTPFSFAEISEDNQGELYVLGFSDGGVYRLEQSDNSGGGGPPALLSETGCFSGLVDGNPIPATGVIEYEVAQRFWSDGAEKSRLLAIPNGSRINNTDPTRWQLPPGGVTIKHFYWAGKIFETRFFVRYDDGSYGGFTYEWNATLTDANIVPREGATKTIELGVDWTYPSRGDCLRCHTAQAGRSLSLESRQLNISHNYASTGLTANQIDTFQQNGMLTVTPPAKLAPYPSEAALTDTAIPLETRVASYLQVNCANCHNGSAVGRANWDASFDRLFENRGLCDREPFEIVNPMRSIEERLVLPQNHSLSTLWIRANDRSSIAMPPIGSTVVDDIGVALLEEWIDGMDAICPPTGATVPARIQAQNYHRFYDSDKGNTGGAGPCDNGDDVDLYQVADNNGACGIGWTTPGEWLEFDFNLPTSREVSINLRMGTGVQDPFPRREASIRIDGVPLGGTIEVSAFGWGYYSDHVISAVPLEAGNHTIRVVFDNGFSDLNYIDIQ